jgi:hypothetical protein
MKRTYRRAWRDRDDGELPLIGLAEWSGTARLARAYGGAPATSWVQTLSYSDAAGPRLAVATYRLPPPDPAKLRAALVRTLTHGGEPSNSDSWPELQISVNGGRTRFAGYVDEVHGWTAVGSIDDKVCTVISWGIPITALALTRLDPRHVPYALSTTAS